MLSQFTDLKISFDVDILIPCEMPVDRLRIEGVLDKLLAKWSKTN